MIHFVCTFLFYGNEDDFIVNDPNAKSVDLRSIVTTDIEAIGNCDSRGK